MFLAAHFLHRPVSLAAIREDSSGAICVEQEDPPQGAVPGSDVCLPMVSKQERYYLVT